jgi:hypothetical protein
MIKLKYSLLCVGLATALVLNAKAQAPGSMALVIGNALYDAANGALVNPHFLQGPPVTLSAAVASDSSLYVQSIPNNNVAKYDLRTGALINPNFIVTNNNAPMFPALAIRGNVLYVAGSYPNRISTFDATTGTPINPAFIPAINAVPLEKILIWGNTLFVAGITGQQQRVTYSYDATTGALINGGALVDPFGPVDAVAVADNYLFGFAPTSSAPAGGGLTAYRITASLGGYFPPVGPGGPYSYGLGGPGSQTTPMAVLGNYLFVTSYGEIQVVDVSNRSSTVSGILF